MASSASSASSSLLKPNTWPSEEAWGKTNAEAFKTSLQSYYDHMCHVATAVLAAICDGIENTTNENNNDYNDDNGGNDTDDNHQRRQPSTASPAATSHPDISSSIRSLSPSQNPLSHTSILTLLGYRNGKRHRGKRARPLVAAHTDVGVVTILLFDGGDAAVLQRAASPARTDASPAAPEREWIDVTLPKNVPDDPIFVVNVGDCTSDLSGGILPSTLHRVMPREGAVPRSCLAFFVGLDPEKELVLPGGERVRYEEWRRRRIARAAAVLLDK